MSPQQFRTCAVCAAPTAQSCAICNKVSYCSKEHQKGDWKAHKPNCFPASVQTSPDLGRYLAATRSIKAGELILKEKPIVSGPNGKNGYHPICLSCYRIVKTNYVCSKCKWPLCSPKCENDPRHAKYECPVFTKNVMKPFSLREIHMYEKIVILRALLTKKLDPGSWARILDLQSHTEERLKSRRGEQLSNSAIEFIRKVCLFEGCEDKDIDHVLGVLGTNAFVTEDNLTSSPLYRSGSYLFYNASLPAHDCQPNSKWTIQMNSEFHLTATLDIQEGESITQLYTASTVGTLERRQGLKESKYFLCQCKRCSDPTELGTFFSGIKCSNYKETSCVGFLLPIHPLDENSLWKCTSPDCNDLKTIQYVEKFVSKLRSNYKARSTEENSVLAVQILENVLRQYLTEFHPNHYLIHEIEQDILQRISLLLASSKAGSAVQLTKKQAHELSSRLVELSRKSLELTEKISPGLTIHRGRQMYFLQQGLTGLISVRIPKGRKRTLTQELLKQIEEIKELRRAGALILSTETEAREEFLLAKYLSDNSTEPIRHILNALNS